LEEGEDSISTFGLLIKKKGKSYSSTQGEYLKKKTRRGKRKTALGGGKIITFALWPGGREIPRGKEKPKGS